MKISSTSSNNPLGGVAGGVRTDSGGNAHPAQQAAAGKSSVDLSAAARHLAASQDGSGDIQAQKVQQIRDALASGELQIDPGRIADGLLASVRDLLK